MFIILATFDPGASELFYPFKGHYITGLKYVLQIQLQYTSLIQLITVEKNRILNFEFYFLKKVTQGQPVWFSG